MLDYIVDFGTIEIFGEEFALRIYGYGLMLVLGFLCGIYLARWRAKRAGEDPEHITRCGILALVGGVIGSRAAYIIQHWQDFADARDPVGEVINITSGGLIYYGGVALATVMVLGYLVIKRRPVRRYLDIIAVSLMVGLAFGRAGCTLHGCCFGQTCRSGWTLAIRFPMYSKPLIKIDGGDNPFSSGHQAPTPVYIYQERKGLIRPDPRLVNDHGTLIQPRNFTPEQIRIAEQAETLPVKPAQPLGMINALLLAGILALFYRIRTREGQVFALMVIMYPITRFFLEMIRGDNPHNITQGVLTHNQVTSIVTVVIGAIMFVSLYFISPRSGPVSAEPSAGR